MKRIFIVHGWGDSPNSHWIPWLKDNLTQHGFEITTPTMPDTDAPKIDLWVPHLNDVASKPDEQNYYIGHSVGCQTIMRHLEQLPDNLKVGGAVFVAPWFKLNNLSGPNEEAIAKSWIETPIDFEKVKSHLPNLFAYFSDDDPWVVMENQKLFKERLSAKTKIIQGKKHIGVDSEMSDFPELLEKVLEIVA